MSLRRYGAISFAAFVYSAFIAATAFALTERSPLRCETLLASASPPSFEALLTRELRGASPKVLEQRLVDIVGATLAEQLDVELVTASLRTLQRLGSIRAIPGKNGGRPELVFGLISPPLTIADRSMRLEKEKAWFVADGVLMEWTFATNEIRCMTSPTNLVTSAHVVAGFPLLVGNDGPFLLQTDGSASVALPNYGLELEGADVRAIASNPRQVLLATKKEILALNHLTQEVEHPFDGEVSDIRTLDASGTRWVFALDGGGQLWRGDLTSRQLSRVPTESPVRDLSVSAEKLLLLGDSLQVLDAGTLEPVPLKVPDVLFGARAIDAYGGSILVRHAMGIRLGAFTENSMTKPTYDPDDAIALAGRLLVRSGHKMNIGFMSKIFWAYHTQQHTDRRNKVLHYVMNAQLLGLLGLGFATGETGFFIAAPSAYPVGWAGHLLNEPNDPATWKYPIGSLATEFVLWWHILRGTRGREELRYDAVAPMRRAKEPKR